ncbi:hypothetical protein TNCV_3037281 [Trichonephila clavipes]|nr:hypothetical protein TNCV_3037281 [Trichonephila clavipes]
MMIAIESIFNNFRFRGYSRAIDSGSLYSQACKDVQINGKQYIDRCVTYASTPSVTNASTPSVTNASTPSVTNASTPSVTNATQVSPMHPPQMSPVLG